MINVRVNNIGAKPPTPASQGSPVPKSLLCIIKYYHNKLYGQLNQCLGEGWIECGDKIEKGGRVLEKSLFTKPEVEYVLAFVYRKNASTPPRLESVADRLIELPSSDILDFWEVYRLADRELKRSPGSVENS
jgi:hypothetical protein